MKQLSLSAILLVLAGPAFAGGATQYRPQPQQPVYSPPPQQVFTPVVNEPTQPRSYWDGWYAGLQYDYVLDASVTNQPGVDFSGNNIGVFGGYRRDFGSLVLAGEVDIMPSGELSGNNTVDTTMYRLGGELGYDLGRTLVYGTIGGADYTRGNTGDTGFYYGIGADYLLSDRFTLGGEILQHSFSDSGGDVNLLTAGVSIAYNF